MGKKGFTLSIPGIGSWYFHAPTVLAQQITDDDPSRLEKPLQVLELSLEGEGFLFLLADEDGKPYKRMGYEPEGFPEFLVEMTKNGMALQTIKKHCNCLPVSAQLLRMFLAWGVSKIAEGFERDIRAGVLTFEEAKEICKEAFEVPRFAKFFRESWMAGEMPKGKRGKRRLYNRDVEELYALACRIYRNGNGISWEAACFDATIQRPDLVPESWRNDPDGNLKREAARYWDKSSYSQLSYRQNRDR